METEKIISLAARLRDKANRFILDELAIHGIKELAPSHGDILYVLFTTDTVSLSDLTNKINRDKSTITALVNKLVRLGYIQKFKNINDSRITQVTLTQKGWKLKPLFFDISEKLIKKLYQGFSEAEKIKMVNGLNKILKNL